MIFVTDDRGETIYISPHWSLMTGRTDAASMQLGWLSQVHAEDRQVIKDALVDATIARTSFMLLYRLLLASGQYQWVMASALPTFDGLPRNFTGFMGTVVEVPQQSEAAKGIVGSFTPQSPYQITAPSTLDLIAHHLMLARAIAHEDEHDALRKAIEIGLHVVWRQLGRPDSLHG